MQPVRRKPWNSSPPRRRVMFAEPSFYYNNQSLRRLLRCLLLVVLRGMRIAVMGIVQNHFFTLSSFSLITNTNTSVCCLLSHTTTINRHPPTPTNDRPTDGSSSSSTLCQRALNNPVIYLICLSFCPVLATFHLHTHRRQGSWLVDRLVWLVDAAGDKVKINVAREWTRRY